EVKKLKEQLTLALALAGQPVESQDWIQYKSKFIAAVRLWKRREEEKRMLLEKVAQLEEAWSQKDKFIHSSRMIVKFREDHISRLENKIKTGQNIFTNEESQSVIDQLKEEISILKEQVEHHPKMTRYAAENVSLREENRLLRSLESVIQADAAAAQVSAELEAAFQTAMEAERTESKSMRLPPTAVDVASVTAMEKLKNQLLQKQGDLAAALQAFEEYKQVTKRQLSQLESDKRYLEKSNRHLEKILEATNAYKKQEVSELNRIHVETIKILTTPTKAYNLRSRIVPFSSPEHLNGSENNEDIWNEQPPTEMTEMALTEELRQVQVQRAGLVQSQLDEAELKNGKLLQEISRLEEQITLLSEECNCINERADRTNEQLQLQETITSLQQSVLSEQQTVVSVLQNEIRDLRMVLQSSDKELASVKEQLKNCEAEQQKEVSHLSNSLISTQLQLDKVQLEWEQLLEQHRLLQDGLDQNQAEAKFETDQTKQHLHDSQQKIEELKTQITDLVSALKAEQENTKSLLSQLRENKESASKWDVVVDLINQTRELRSDLSQKDTTITHLTEDLKEITEKSRLQKESVELKESMDRREASNKIEVEVLQEEVAYATEEVERLTKVLDEQNALLQASQEQVTQKDAMIKSLQQKVSHLRLHNYLCSKRLIKVIVQIFVLFQTPCTPGSFNRDLSQVLESQERENRCLELRELNQRVLDEEKLLQVRHKLWGDSLTSLSTFMCSLLSYVVLQENEVLRKQNVQLSEENGKLVGHKNHKQRIEYLVKLKKDNTKLQEVCWSDLMLLLFFMFLHFHICFLKENEKLRSELNLLRENIGCLPALPAELL
uniref:Uncharacterized protein n=1 Tax=Periophthalmus magnuspinnatus TaxID=409849 RepID=A0A3B4A5W6_9GOBI